MQFLMQVMWQRSPHQAVINTYYTYYAAMILCYLLYMKTIHDDGRVMRTVTWAYLWPPFYTSFNDSYRTTGNILSKHSIHTWLICECSSNVQKIFAISNLKQQYRILVTLTTFSATPSDSSQISQSWGRVFFNRKVQNQMGDLYRDFLYHIVCFPLSTTYLSPMDLILYYWAKLTFSNYVPTAPMTRLFMKPIIIYAVCGIHLQ